jgi:Holliday junction resolvasome RuvABC DNA-binding subunit
MPKRNIVTRKLHKKNDDIYVALIARGYSGKELEKMYTKTKASGITIDELIKQFIDEADRDPRCINETNCQDGKCTGCTY